MQNSSLTAVPPPGAAGGQTSSTSCLCIQGLCPSDDDLSIRQLMVQRAGVPGDDVEYSQAVLDRQTGQCTGLGFVQFRSESAAQKANKQIQSELKTGGIQERLRVRFAFEIEKDRRSVLLWNLPVKCSDDWIREVLIKAIKIKGEIISRIRSVKAIPSNPKYCVGFINFTTEKDAAQAIEFINRNGLLLSEQFGCLGRIAARLPDKQCYRSTPPTATVSASEQWDISCNSDSDSQICFDDIVEPNPLLCEISAEPFQLKTAESPFKWNAHEDSDRLPEDVISKILERVRLEPMLSSAYYGLLAAYHSATSLSRKCIDFRKARIYLKDAVDAAKDAGEHHVRCEFVLKAISLNLDEQQKKKSSDFAERVKALGEAWDNPDETERIQVRANTFYVKALASFHQGILKYSEAEEAVKASLSLRRDNFMCVYLLAYILARKRRHISNRTPADPKELLLWELSLQLALQQKLKNGTDGIKLYFYRFRINYAEAIVCNPELKEICQQLANETFKVVKEFKSDVLEKHCRIALKCEKVFRLLRVQPVETEMLQQMLLGLKDATENAQLLYTLARIAERKRDDEACEGLLLRAQEVAFDPGNIWVDIFLQEHRAGRLNKFTEEFVLEEFDTMIAKYRDNPRYVAVSQYAKGVFMCNRNRFIDGFFLMVESVEGCPDVRVHFPEWQLSETLRVLSQRTEKPECEAWFRQHMLGSELKRDMKMKIAELYKKALNSDQSDHQLVHEHIGLLHIDLGEFQAAEESFRSLQSDNPRKKSLLSSALLKLAEAKDGAEKRDLIFEALGLGSLKACKLAMQLLDDRLEQQHRCPLEAIKQKYSPADTAKPVQIMPPWLFSKDSYELLARVCIVSEGANEDVSDRFSLAETDLQKIRLSLERLDPLGKNSGIEYNNAVIKTLMDAKSAMDGLWAKFVQESLTSDSRKSEYFPYGFNFLKDVKDCDQKIRILNETPHDDRSKKIKDKLSYMVKIRGSANEEAKQRLNSIRDLLYIRECKVFRDQTPFGWLVAWQDVVNKVKHDNRDQAPLADFVSKLVEALGCDLECAGSVAHMAAEFVEETRLILEATAEDLRAALGQTETLIDDSNSVPPTE